MRTFLLTALVALTFSSFSFSSTDMYLASNDDYDVGGGGTYHSPDGLAPQKECTTECTSEYHACTADCFRDDILLMGGCIAGCKMNNCSTHCE
ncbi:hypothetical protein HNR75_001686 [Tolumonas osonensis]|uniref:Uncharacterized protein n=1 Tax=Tolumonas osonensis TaxID=675874 RepID=A0A841G9P9_9GAMM|nr:hypothetical protein [Tolumonas osonensis]